MKIAAIDLDGTLLHSDCTISDYSKEVITKAIKNGIIVIPTSGRSFRSIKKQVKDIEGIRYCAGGNGSIVSDIRTEEILYNHKIPQDAIYSIYKEVKRRDGFLELYCDNDSYVEKGMEKVMYETKLPKEFCDNLLATAVPALSFDLLLRRGTMRVNKIHAAFRDENEMKDFAAKVLENENLVVTFPSEFNMEIFDKGCNKDTSLRILCEKYGIDRKDTIAIGDSNNDVAMIDYAYFGVAVENAMDELKEHADYITRSNDEDGPAIVLEKILKNEK